MIERSLRVGDVELVFTEAGNGGRPLLVIHGFTGAKEDFSDHVTAFAEAGFHVVIPDNRGHGKSSKPHGEHHYSLQKMAADALGLCDALGWDEFFLLGHSMGGMIAQLVALEAPGRVPALILVDTCHGPLEGVDRDLAMLGVETARKVGIGPIVEASKAGPGPLDTPARRRLLRERPEVAARSERNLSVCSPHMYAAMLSEMLEQPDRLDALSGLDIPTLVLVGEQDRPFLGPSRRMAEAIPGAELVVVEDAGHSPQNENPTAWRSAVMGFLGRLGAGGGGTERD
ncbi:MAG: hypothetical protein KatS3mg008_1825 [Acidimicrobiales bacterium]|nr:MAG: hypothetical protein KatS3mg008_1825 [Acidimicrobiales bacterium]